MMSLPISFVLDNSVTMAWCFPDENNAYAEMVLRSLRSSAAVVPAIWSLEVANTLLVGERRNRLSISESGQFIGLLSKFPIFIDEKTSDQALKISIELGRNYQLSSYDACYIELSLRLGLPIATLDEKLKKVSIQLGIAEYKPAHE